MKKEKVRKIFLEDFPKKHGIGALREQLVIDCINSIGCKIRFIYGDIEGKIEIIDYDKLKRVFKIKYDDNPIMKIPYGHLINCQLGKILNIRTSDFKIKINDVLKDTKRNITIIDREYRPQKTKTGITKQKWYKYRCNKCGFNEGWIIEGSLLWQNSGCSVCCESPQIVVEGINDIPTTAPFMTPYFQGGYNEAKKYTKSSNKKIYPICPDCGRIKDKELSINNIYNRKSIRCICGDSFSYGHKYIFSLLNQLDLDFCQNKKFDWCIFPSYKNELKISKGEYDFVIENMKLIIEVDGGFHRQDNTLSGQTKEHSKYLDDMKDFKAKTNKYKIIRISDENNIKDNIIKSKLNNIFDLSNIDWLKCEEFALSNRVKEACELKRNNPNYTVKDIAKIMSISNNTILNYLHKGSDLGWCNYNPEEEKEKSQKSNVLKNIERCSKLIEIFKNNISLGTFKSATELERQSMELFGVKLLQSKISAVARGSKPQYKGFTFKFAN